MRPLLLFLALSLLLPLGAATGCSRPTRQDEVQAAQEREKALLAQQRRRARRKAKKVTRPARAASEGAMARARSVLGADARQERCGPYRLLTDVTDRRRLLCCQRLGGGLDRVYRERYGLQPVGEPRETIFLFAEMADFREFARRDGRLRVGYAGYASAGEGFLALPAGVGDVDAFATTLAHELTHLVHRRALGSGLPPWLSEGLADGIGDSATAEGLGPLVGFRGVEGQRRRLLLAYGEGEVPSLERLTAAKRGEFDRGQVSYDYEQSALFVRFLLSQPELAQSFREFLSAVAQGGAASGEALREALGWSWSRLDRELERWVKTGA